MTASGDIVTETRANTIAVPIQCVAVRTPEQLIKTPAAGNSGEVIANEQDAAEFTPDRDGFVSLVFIIKDGVAEARQVVTGIQSDNYIEILDGISEGEEVVTGNYRAISKDLQNGSQVSVKNDPNGGERT